MLGSHFRVTLPIRRRIGCRVLLGCSLLTSCASPINQPRATSPAAYRADGQHLPRTPNIVFILADDLGIGDVGAYGQTRIKTPNIDRLRAQGMLFTDHYSGSSVCSPSRASLLTGRDTGHAQVRGNKAYGGYTDETEEGQEPLRAGSNTLATMLRRAGYATGGFGKWGLGFRDNAGAPTRQGFDTFMGWLDQKQAHNYYPTHLWLNGERFPLRNPPILVHRNYKPNEAVPADAYHQFMGPDYGPASVEQKALDFIRDNQRKPFFAYLAYLQPHASLQVPDADIRRFGYAGAFPETPYEGRAPGGYAPHPTPRAARAAMITRMDEDVGRVLTELDELGLADNTVVIFTSDNGASPEGGADIGFFDSTGGLRGEKRDLYEGGIRAPLIVRWPGHVAPQTTSHFVSAFWDFMPTLAAIARVKVGGPTEGVSMLPTLLAKPGQRKHDHLYWEYTEKPAQAVREGNWKAVRRYHPAPSGRLSAGPIELYDLINDRSERRNVASAHPAIVLRMRAVMASRTQSYIPQWNFTSSAGAAGD